jgi:hypothetical protein
MHPEFAAETLLLKDGNLDRALADASRAGPRRVYTRIGVSAPTIRRLQAGRAVANDPEQLWGERMRCVATSVIDSPDGPAHSFLAALSQGFAAFVGV